MVRVARIVLVAILLGFLLFKGPNNPFAFVPPYIGLPTSLELVCCVAVGLAICYAVEASWTRSRPSEDDTLHAGLPARGMGAVIKAFIWAFAVFLACCFAAVSLHYFIGFSVAVAVAYVFLVVVVIAAVEAVRRNLRE